jgi:Na+-driven multidrug efflux pump
MIWQFPALAIMKGTNGFIQGIGNAKLSFIFAVFDGVILRVLLSWFLGIYLNMGLYGFFLGFALATYGTAIPGLIYFLFVPWYKRKRVF